MDCLCLCLIRCICWFLISVTPITINIEEYINLRIKSNVFSWITVYLLTLCVTNYNLCKCYCIIALFGACTYSRKTAFWENVKTCVCPCILVHAPDRLTLLSIARAKSALFSYWRAFGRNSCITVYLYIMYVLYSDRGACAPTIEIYVFINTVADGTPWWNQ